MTPRQRTLPVQIGDVIAWGRGSDRYRAQRAIVAEISVAGTGGYSRGNPPEVALILTALPQGDGAWRGTRSTAEVRFTHWDDEYGYLYEVDLPEYAFVVEPVYDDDGLGDLRLTPLQDGKPRDE